MPAVAVLFKDQSRLINLHQQYKMFIKILGTLYKLVYQLGEEVPSMS